MDTIDEVTKSRAMVDLNAEISTLEAQIDSHVYRLYGLTAAEIATVEENAK